VGFDFDEREGARQLQKNGLVAAHRDLTCSFVEDHVTELCIYLWVHPAGKLARQVSRCMRLYSIELNQTLIFVIFWHFLILISPFSRLLWLKEWQFVWNVKVGV
jgi:hypothetical protein